MLELDSWIKAAKRLALGREARVPHHCGEGNVMKVSFDGERWSAYCFRCSDSGSLKNELPLAERLALIQKQRDAEASIFGDTAPPEPRTPWAEWPVEARLWLLKAGLSAADVPGLGAYYHLPTKRVVLTVLCPSGGGYWLARALKWKSGDPRPKYLARPGGAQNAVPKYGKAARIVLTEDLLSAYKIGKVGEAWCLLGTSIRNRMLGELLADGRPVSVWLDPDHAGIKAANKVAAALRAYGVRTTIIRSERDPKLHHAAEIKEIIGA
jgi:hypothetical protein